MSYITLAVLVTAVGLIAMLMAMGKRSIHVAGGSAHAHGLNR